MRHVVLMIGIPGSGKTAYVRERLSGHAHVSLDINRNRLTQRERGELIRRYESEDPLRLNAQVLPSPSNPAGRAHSKRLSRSQGSGNRRAEYVQISDALAAGRSVVVDDTNLTRETRWPYIALAKRYGATVTGVSFLNVQQALDRNRKRANGERVPDGIMTRMCRTLEHPDMSEGFDSIRTVYG